MRCRALECRENENGYCTCDSYIEIDETGQCDMFLQITESENIEKK